MALTASQPNNLTRRRSPPATPAAPAMNPRSYTGQSTWQQPTYIDPSKYIKYAGIGLPSSGSTKQLKQLDRAGQSWQGQDYRAAMASATQLGESRMNAANTQLEADKANAQMKTDLSLVVSKRLKSWLVCRLRWRTTFTMTWLARGVGTYVPDRTTGQAAC